MDYTPPTQDIVLVGGGHAHIEVLRRFGMRAEPGVRLTLISREIETPYSGMLPGYIAGHYSTDDFHINLEALCRFAGARCYHNEVTAIDLLTRSISCEGRPAVSFDLLSIDTGSAPNTRIPGADKFGTPVKPVSNFTIRWQALCQRIEQHAESCRIGVVGAGAGGVELILAAQHFLCEKLTPKIAQQRLSFHLLTSGSDILPGHNARVRRSFHDILRTAGIEVITDFEVTRVEAQTLYATNGASIALNEVLWTTSAEAPWWPREAGFATDEQGFIRVNDTLECVAHEGIFAAGDIACVDPHPRPKSGVFAVRQGPVLAANLRRAARGEAPKPFRPQRNFLSLISTGARFAVASRGALCAQGPWLWRLKDFIDRRFIERYRDLPEMDSGETTAIDDPDLAAAMRCGGCGSKIGAEVLEQALRELAPASAPDIVIGLDAADDAAVVRTPPGMLAVHTVDAFRSFIDDPYTLGKVAAVHALSDIYAMGASPTTALAMVTLPLARASLMRSDLIQLMRGAGEIFDREQVRLIGGHTGEGSEMAIGFAVNGFVSEAQLIRKRGVRSNAKLILTQALGSGVLFAGAMQNKTRAGWLRQALVHMTQSKKPAAALLAEHQAMAMTDVTGFGLIGHLREMLAGSNCQARISLASLPLYNGAKAMVEADVLSSLQAQNRRAEHSVTASNEIQQSALYELAFDPQTAGGLLAAIPAEQSTHCLQTLHEAGYEGAACIGDISAGDALPTIKLEP